MGVAAMGAGFRICAVCQRNQCCGTICNHLDAKKSVGAYKLAGDNGAKPLSSHLTHKKELHDRS
jgi:hypothetical protein